MEAFGCQADGTRFYPGDQSFHGTGTIPLGSIVWADVLVFTVFGGCCWCLVDRDQTC